MSSSLLCLVSSETPSWLSASDELSVCSWALLEHVCVSVWSDPAQRSAWLLSILASSTCDESAVSSCWSGCMSTALSSAAFVLSPVCALSSFRACSDVLSSGSEAIFASLSCWLFRDWVDRILRAAASSSAESLDLDWYSSCSMSSWSALSTSFDLNIASIINLDFLNSKPH